MKENDRQLLRFFLLWLVLPFIVGLSFYGISRKWKDQVKILATSFSLLFPLHCYRQVASIFTFISGYYDTLLLLKSLF